MLYVWGTPVMANVDDIIDVLMMELKTTGSHLLKDRKLTHGNIMLTCISHKDGLEATPSMGVLTDDLQRGDRTAKAGSVNCFVCGYTADIAEFVSNCFGHLDRGYYGYKWITANFVNLSIENRKDIPLDMSRGSKAESEIVGISEEELASYRYTHPYMYKRKLTDKVIDYFDVGYDERTNALTFPVHDLSGKALFLQRRAVEGKRFQNDVTTLKGSVVYGLYHVYRNISWIKEIYVTESILDALTLWTHRKAAVATLQAIPTSQQIQLLRKAPVRHIISAHDDDSAGKKGAKRLKEELGDVKLVSRVNFPNEINPDTDEYYKDMNEMEDRHIQDLTHRIL